jgi:hypothetical protein
MAAAAPREAIFALHVFVPVAAAAAVRAASWTSAPGVGRFRPLEGARPAVGAVGVAEEVAEVLVVTEVLASRLPRALGAVRRVHPYEAPGVHVFGPLLDIDAILAAAAEEDGGGGGGGGDSGGGAGAAAAGGDAAVARDEAGAPAVPQ